MVGPTPVFAGGFEGLLELWWKKDFSTFTFLINRTTTTVLLGIVNLYCKSQAARDNEWIPEGLKSDNEGLHKADGVHGFRFRQFYHHGLD